MEESMGFKALKHFRTITKHRHKVMIHCFKCGLIKQGLLHDLSKYMPCEFITGVRYYQGNRSPNAAEKEEKGYSTAWLHHKGRNKHHHEYWYDYAAPEKTPIMPYKYTVEMICDTLAAGMTYQGKNWTNDYQLNYYLQNRRLIE